MKSKQSVADASEEIFLITGHPLHYKVLTPLLLGKCNLMGKTPHETVRSALATNPKFKRVAEGTYALSIWTEYPAIRFAKDIAYDILMKEGKPIRLVLLGEQILKERKFIGSPGQIVRGILNTDNRFYYDTSLGVVGLSEWKTQG